MPSSLGNPDGRDDARGDERVSWEESQPLMSWQEAFGLRAGAAARAKYLLCCCWKVEALFFALGLVMILLLASINMNVLTIDLEQYTDSKGINMAELEGILQSHATDFCTIFTSNTTSELFLIEFPLELIAEGIPMAILMGASFASGTYTDDHSTMTLLHYPAENTDQTLFTFRLAEDMSGVDLLRKELTLSTSDEETLLSLEESAPPQWMATLPVLDVRARETGDGINVLTDASILLMNGFFVTGIQEGTFSSVRLKLSETRAFPKNAGITVEYQLIATKGLETVTVPETIRFSMSEAPSELMQSRRADERVGYFTTVFQDLGDHRATDSKTRSSDLLDTEVRMINKRRMGGSKLPLIYYIDPSVPEEWRGYMKIGVENWQPAFEAVGLGDKAIRAVLPGDDDWPEDYDAGDIRFNSITWVIDPTEVFALGPSTIDPRTGEILHSAIIFTSGWISAWTRDFELFRKSEPKSSRRSLLANSPLKNEFERKYSHARSHSHNDWDHGHHHDHHHHGNDHHGHRHSHSRSPARGGKSMQQGPPQSMGAFGNDLSDLRRDVHSAWEMRDGKHVKGDKTGFPFDITSGNHGGVGSLRYHDRSECQEARLKDISSSLLPLVAAHHARSRSLADGKSGDSMGATPGLVTNEILGAGLADVTMHEVGHTLGLRHNFQASTSLSLEELQDVSKTSDNGLTSSVMDYLPLNFVSSKLQGSEEPHYFTPKIGEYDMWAIKYGYMKVEDEKLLEEHQELKDVASEALPFSTDEDDPGSTGINPLVSLFDLGSEPLDFWEDRLELVTELRAVLLDRTVQEGEPFTRYARGEEVLMRQLYNAGLHANKYIGGFDMSKQRRVSDSTPGPVQLIAPNRQRRALSVVLRLVGGDEPGGMASFLASGEEFTNMAVRDGECGGSLEQYCYALKPLDLLSEVAFNRKMLLLELFGLTRMQRMCLHAWVTEDKSNGSGTVLTVPELFQMTTDAVWGEGAFSGQRVKLWQNWDVMLFWFELLQAYGAADSLSGVPGVVTATAAGMMYSIAESGAQLNATHPAYSLYRTVSRSLNLWEEHGYDGVLLSLLVWNF